MKLPLYTVLKASYQSPAIQKKKLLQYGYVRDDVLSDKDEQVYWNPSEKKILFSITGTHQMSDFGADIWLAMGGLKKTNRYKRAHKLLREAKQKYNAVETVVTGHSLGGSVAALISTEKDKTYTLDRGYVGQRARAGQTHYRAKGDIVSVLDRRATMLGASPEHSAHAVDQIARAQIFV